MNLQFATCERHRALSFLKKLYPSYAITDTPENAGPILDLVAADIVRVTDPDFHQGMIVPGTHWDEQKRDEVVKIGKAFHVAIGLEKEQP